MNLNVKKDFPIFSHQPGLVFLDNAATTQKPAIAINAEKEFYETTYTNIHRATYDIATRATDLFEGTRAKVKRFINVPIRHPGGVEWLGEILFTRNASEALNLAAYILGQSLKEGDELLVSVAGHHSNILPWMRLATAKKLVLKWIEITVDGRLDIAGLKKNLSSKTKVVAVEHVSNVLGYVNPLAEIVAAAHEVGAVVVADAAQSSCRMPIDVTALDVDFMAFSGHKMYGPTGSGWLYGKKHLMAEAEPLLVGGGTIKTVTREKIEWAEAPFRFEAGTPDIASVVALGSTLDYLSQIGMQNVWEHDQALTKYGLEKLLAVPGFKLFGPQDGINRAAIFSFLIEVNLSAGRQGGKAVHSHDVAEIANSMNVAMRGGHHCAQPLMQALQVEDVNRASLGMYNSEADIDALVEVLAKVQSVFDGHVS
jgi:cysteine desulfurase/selenocysteine lyase